MYKRNILAKEVTDVILINPFQLDGGYWKTIAPPLGLAYIASSLEKNGVSVKILDMVPLGLSNDDVLSIVRKECPILIGIPLTLFSLEKCKKLAESLKKECPEIKIVVGGAFPTLYPTETLEYSNSFDYALRGEAEFSFVELFRSISSGQILNGISGLCYRNNNKDNIISNEIPKIDKLDDIPFPAYHLLPLKEYYETTEGSKNFCGIITSRGCPFSCIFCLTGKIYGKKCRERSVVNVLDEIEYLYKKFDIRNIVFWDDTFTINKNRVIDICKGIIERNLKIDYRIRSRVDYVDEEILYYLKKSGCTYISYGVESGDQEILDRIKKGTSIKQIESVFNLTHSIGIKTVAYFMIGNFGETEDTIRKTIDFSKKLNSIYAIFTIATPLPGTEFYKIVEREASGHLFFDITSLNDWHTKPALNRTELPKNMILKFQRQAYLEFYFRPKYIFKFAKDIELSELMKNLKAFSYLLRTGIFSIPKET